MGENIDKEKIQLKKVSKLRQRIICFMMTLMLILPMVSNAAPAVVLASETNVKSTTYEKEGYSITYTVKAQWQEHKVIEISLENTGSQPIRNWMLEIPNVGEMSGLWNAEIYSADAQNYIIQSRDYNNTIKPAGKITLGYTLEGSELPEPADISLCILENVSVNDYSVSYEAVSDWGDEFQGGNQTCKRNGQVNSWLETYIHCKL